MAETGELMVTVVAESYAISLPAVSKHLRVLESAGLLVQHKDGRIRRCQMVPGPLVKAYRWIEQYRHFWEGQLDSLAEYLDHIQNDGGSMQAP